MANKTLPQFQSLDPYRKFFILVELYGCYNREALEKVLAKSTRSISTQVSWLATLIQEQERAGIKQKNQAISIAYERYSSGENHLISLYYQKKFSENHLNYHFLLLFLLAQAEKPLSLQDCADGVEVLSSWARQEEEGDKIDTIKRSLQELVSLGFVGMIKEKQKFLYVIQEELHLPSEEWGKIQEILTYFRNVTPLHALGYFCFDAVGEQRLRDATEEIPSNVPSPFVLKNHFPHEILEDDLALLCLEAFETDEIIKFSFTEVEGEQEREYEVAPLRLLSNPGRLYLFGFDFLSQKPVSLPLWKMSKMKKIKKTNRPNADTTEKKIDFDKEAVLSLIHKSWSMTRLELVDHPLKAPLKLVEIQFTAQKGSRISEGRSRLEQRLIREKRQGTYEKIGESTFLFTVSVIEPREMIPWIRSFGAQAKVTPSKDHQLAQVLEENRKELLARYGTVSHTEK